MNGPFLIFIKESVTTLEIDMEITSSIKMDFRGRIMFKSKYKTSLNALGNSTCTLCKVHFIHYLHSWWFDSRKLCPSELSELNNKTCWNQNHQTFQSPKTSRMEFPRVCSNVWWRGPKRSHLVYISELEEGMENCDFPYWSFMKLFLGNEGNSYQCCTNIPVRCGHYMLISNTESSSYHFLQYEFHMNIEISVIATSIPLGYMHQHTRTKSLLLFHTNTLLFFIWNFCLISISIS